MFNYRTMTVAAEIELRKAILRGDYPPGTRLIPAKLEDELNLSKTAIREAIRELVGTGLLESLSNKGAFVAEALDLDEIKAIFSTRSHLEGEAALLGTQKITEDDIEKMEALLDQIEPGKEMTTHDLFLINKEFHMLLYRASGWKYLIKEIYRMFDQVMIFRSSLYRQLPANQFEIIISRDRYERFIAEHREIVNKVRERQAETVSRLIVENIKNMGLKEIIKIHDDISSTHKNK